MTHIIYRAHINTPNLVPAPKRYSVALDADSMWRKKSPLGPRSFASALKCNETTTSIPTRTRIMIPPTMGGLVMKGESMQCSVGNTGIEQNENESGGNGPSGTRYGK